MFIGDLRKAGAFKIIVKEYAILVYKSFGG
jgi:hypothetical protein